MKNQIEEDNKKKLKELKQEVVPVKVKGTQKKEEFIKEKQTLKEAKVKEKKL